jgi:hypothetical protein
MADTYTSNLSLVKPEVGASDNTWGTKLNTNLDAIDALFTSGPALLVSKGGTGATTADGARSNLGLGTLATQNASSVSVGALVTTGNVGVKTSNPTTALDVNGSLKASSLTLSGALTAGTPASFSGTVSAGTVAASSEITIPSTAALKDASGNRLVGFGVGVKRNNNLTISPSTETTISWEAEDWDDANMWSSGGNIAVPKNGYYIVSLVLTLSVVSGSGIIQIKLLRNGSQVAIVSYGLTTSSKQFDVSFLVRETAASANYSVAAYHSMSYNVTLGTPTSARVACMGTF